MLPPLSAATRHARRLACLLALWPVLAQAAPRSVAPRSVAPRAAAPRAAAVDTAAPPPRTLFAVRTATAPAIDGVLEAALYGEAPVTGEFTNLEPTFGPIERWPTRVRVLYDDRALYIGAEMTYPSPDSIAQEVRPRDQIGNADWFGFGVDPYRSGVNGFEFIVSVTGGQFDAIFSPDGEDANWDAVWRNAVTVTDRGWVCELEIPYSAIRFPEVPVQSWGVNFFRRNALAQHKSFWSPVDPNKPGFLPQFGRLEGIRDISPPPRIQLTPFAVVTGADYIDPGAERTHNLDADASFGADLKLGLSDAFTLDATLVPDFSEARQDDQVLNLSPFEVRFDENRPFFTEGVELFNKGGYFYSRRVGGAPVDFAEARAEAERLGGRVVSNPQTTRLLNATKVSGRTTKGTGIGLFNAVSAESRAVIATAEGDEREVVTQPLTNYSVAVVDQLLPHNGFVTLVNTNVLRSGSTYDANLTGLVFDVRNAANTYGIEGDVAVSQRYFPDADAELGRNINVGLGDIDGAWTWRLGYEEIGPDYNPSDLGFFRRRNVRELVASLNYFRARELGPFNRVGGGLNAGYERYVRPDDYSELWFNAYVFARTKANWNVNPFVYVEPGPTRDRFEPRVEGRYFERPASAEFGVSVRSDERRKLYFNGVVVPEVFWNEDLGRRGLFAAFRPSYRVSPNFTIGLGIESNRNLNEGGFATFVDGAPVFGRRDREVLENSLRVVYTVTPTLGFDLRARHYWSRVKYDGYYDLLEDGGLRQNPQYASRVDRDETFSALTADLVCRWRFAPGSDLLFVWKDALFAGVAHAEDDYFGTWRNGLMREPRTETLSLKVNYFLDYNELRRRRR